MPGAAAADAPVFVGGQERWFLSFLRGGFVIVGVVAPASLYQDSALPDGRPGGAALAATITNIRATAIAPKGAPTTTWASTESETADMSADWLARYDARPGTTYLFRPDQHVVARWRSYDDAKVQAAIMRAKGG